MKINFHIRESFLILIFLNLKERSLKVLNLKKHGLEHCYNSSRLFSNDSFPYHSHKDNLLQLFIIIAIGGQLTRSNFFLHNLEGTSKKMECLFKWPLKKKKEQSIFQNAHIFLFYFFSHEKNLNLSLLFFINGPIKEAHYKRKNNCVNGCPPLIN